jgi:hypothetical protein
MLVFVLCSPFLVLAVLFFSPPPLGKFVPLHLVRDITKRQLFSSFVVVSFSLLYISFPLFRT